jgi:hypothetical protein
MYILVACAVLHSKHSKNSFLKSGCLIRVYVRNNTNCALCSVSVTENLDNIAEGEE